MGILDGIKIALVSLGCDKNLMDSEVMLGLVQEAGCVLVPEQADADVIIVNTCGFILDAAQESVDHILDAAAYKEKGTCRALVVTGCLAQRYGADIFEELEGVDAIVGTNDYAAIAEAIEQALAGSGYTALEGEKNMPSEDIMAKRVISTRGHYEYMKIAEGCDNHCTYCTIPRIRGHYRSRKLEALVAEAEMLAAKGVKELILVAQDTSLYGKALYGEPSLHILLQKLSAIAGIRWIRLMYCYPEHIYDELIAEIANNPKVLPYIDMPIQHADDTVLKRMGRRSTEDGLYETISKLREAVPEIILRTTIITGFPGESKEAFDNLAAFMEEMRFDRLGVFAYSREEDTPADALSGHLPDKLKQKRRNNLMAIQQEITAQKAQEQIGRELLVMVEDYLADEARYMGRSYMDAPFSDGYVFFPSEKKLAAGDFVTVRVTGAAVYDLEGEVISYDDELAE